MEQQMSDEQIRAQASQSLAGGNIRERVRDLTLQALRERRFDFAGMREVLRLMTEGISVGAQSSRRDLRLALSEAFAGMDQALSKAAQAGSLAMKELAERGREHSAGEFKQGLDNLRRLEGDLLDALRQVSQSTAGAVKSEWQELALHAQRAGTDTGRVVAQTVREFSSRIGASASEGALAGMDAARVFAERFAALASGMLAGMSEALRPEPDTGEEVKAKK